MQVEKHKGGMLLKSCDISSALDLKVMSRWEELEMLKNVHRQTNAGCHVTTLLYVMMKKIKHSLNARAL